jgi:diacylglycerol kinase (ATP)
MERHHKGSLVASFRHALDGMGYTLRSERNARIHLLIALLVTALGAWLRIEPLEWALIVAAIALVFAGEMLNTVVELTLDLAMPDENPLAKHAKDVAAGAILVAAAAAAAIGIIIMGPRLARLLGLF